MNIRDAATHGTFPAFPLPWALNRSETTALTLRDWLAHLARTGRLATIERPVALEHELAAIAKRLDGTQAAFFTQPGRKVVPVVSGFMSKRGWIAEALGVEEAGLLARFSAAVAQPIASRVVDRAIAP